MNPFERTAGQNRSELLMRLRESSVLIVVLASLGIGLGLVAWRTQAGADSRRARAGAEARAISSALELQIEQAISAAQVVGGFVKQDGVRLDYKKAAADALATRPGIASLELQPGGIVTDVYPRQGHERAIGFNSLRHPACQLSAKTALQKRVVTVAGPLRLRRGDAGLVVIVPIYSKPQDRSESFWGFVAASVAFPDMLARARVNELAAKGYSSIVFATVGADRKTVVLAQSGSVSLASAVQQPIRARNVEVGIALQPRTGWVSKSELLFECALALLVSGLLCGAMISWANQKKIRAQLGEVRQQLAASVAARSQMELQGRKAQESAAAIQAELVLVRSERDQERRAGQEAAHTHQVERERSQAALQQAEEALHAVRTELEQATRMQKESMADGLRRQEQDRAAIAELQGRLDRAIHSAKEAAQTSLTERERAEAALKEAQQTIRTLRARLEEASRQQQESAATARDRQDQDQAIIADLRAQLEASAGSTDDPEDQMNLWGIQQPSGDEAAGAEPGIQETSVGETAQVKEPKSPGSRSSAAPPPAPALAVGELRRAFHQILPLLVDHDPGAADCLEDNRTLFRSVFAPEDYEEFQEWTKAGKFSGALEHLKKAAKRNGITL